MTRSELATRTGTPESFVRECTRPGNILADRPHGAYTEGDAALVLALVEMKRLWGEKSAQPLELARRMAPAFLSALSAAPSEACDILRVRVELEDGSGPVVSTLDFNMSLLKEYAAA